MALLPIVDRELRVAARRQGTYRLRAVAASVVLLIVAGMLLASQNRAQAPELGQSIYRLITLLAFGFSLLSGVFLTSDALSEERRDGTLGLLFLTDLRSLDVVVGKMFVHSLGGVYALLTVFPVMAIPLLMGGTSPAEYGRVCLAILNTLFLSLSAGLLVSALCQEQQKSVMGSLVLLMGLAGILPGLGLTLIPGVLGLVQGFLTASGAAPWLLPVGLWNQLLAANSKLLWISPGYTYYLSFDANFRAGGDGFYYSLATSHVLAWCFLLGAIAVTPRMLVASPVIRKLAGRNRWGWLWGQKGAEARRLRWLEISPVYCLARRGSWQHVFTWCMVCLVTVNVSWLTFGDGRWTTNPLFQRYFGNTIYFINRVWVTVLACQFFLEARRSGALEILLSTPLSIRAILKGQWMALKRVLLWPVFVIGLLHWFYVISRYELYVVRYNSLQGFEYHAIAAAGSFISFLADVFALSWVGMWMALSSKRPGWAIFNTFLYVTVLPWIAFYFVPDMRVLFPNHPMAYYVGRPIVWVTKDVLFILWAWWSLRARFRSAASQSLWRPRLRWGWKGRGKPPGTVSGVGAAPGSPAKDHT